MSANISKLLKTEFSKAILKDLTNFGDTPIARVTGLSWPIFQLTNPKSPWHQDIAHGGAGATVSTVSVGAIITGAVLGSAHQIRGAYHMATDSLRKASSTAVPVVAKASKMKSFTKILFEGTEKWLMPIGAIAGAAESVAGFVQGNYHRGASALGATSGGILGGMAAGTITEFILGQVTIPIPFLGGLAGMAIGGATGLSGAVIGRFAANGVADMVDHYKAVQKLPNPYLTKSTGQILDENMNNIKNLSNMRKAVNDAKQAGVIIMDTPQQLYISPVIAKKTHVLISSAN